MPMFWVKLVLGLPDKNSTGNNYDENYRCPFFHTPSACGHFGVHFIHTNDYIIAFSKLDTGLLHPGDCLVPTGFRRGQAEWEYTQEACRSDSWSYL